MKNFNEEEVTKLIPTSKQKEGTPTRVMLGNLKILNPGESINQRITLQDMAKIGIGAPMTRLKVSLIECRRTI